MTCCGPKTSPRTSSIVQIIFTFLSFEISEDILKNQKIIIGLDSYSNQRSIYLAPFLARLHEVHRAIAVTPDVHVSVPVPVRVTLALKFCRSPYLDIRKHLYLDHRYPVGLVFIPWHQAPGSRPGGGAGGYNLEHLQKWLLLCKSFLEVHILTTTHQKALILGPLTPCRVGFHSMASDLWVHARG